MKRKGIRALIDEESVITSFGPADEKLLPRQAAKRPSANYLAPGSNSPSGGLAGTSDQGSERPPSRRTREQAAAGSRRLRSGATIAEPDEEDQLMSLDASGKPVVVARPASAKAGSSLPSRIKTSSSTSHSMPGSKPKGSASGNRSTAGSQRPGSAKPSKGRLAPLSIPTGQDQADSPRSPNGPAQSPTSALLPTSTRSADPSAPAEGTDKAEEENEQAPSTSSKPNLSPVLKSTRGPVPAKVGSPRSPRQPASPSERKTRAGAESRRALEEAAAAAEKTLAEDAIIEQAQIIYERRNTKQLPVFPEPKRGKAHWDHVLEEMNWMAKEFSKERRWKIAQAKRFAKLVSKSNLDVEGRERLRRREELLNLKKRAAWIAKEAMQFWRKAERVVQYKQQVVSNARKKEVMDKHLDFLALSKAEGGTNNELHSLEAEADMPLEQLLAQYGYVMGGGPGTVPDDDDDGITPDSSGKEQKAKAIAPAGLTERPAKRQRTSKGDAQPSNPAAGLSKTQPAAAQDSAAQLSGSQASGEPESESDQSSADLRDLLDSPQPAAAADSARYRSRNSLQPGPSKQVVSKREKTNAALPKQELDDLGSESQSDSEFDSVAGSDVAVDDEQTLEEEERMAEAEGAAQHASELEDLEDEANMPLEQLMARYGYTASTHVATPSHPSSAPPASTHPDAMPSPADTSTKPSSPSRPPHTSPQGPAKPASSRSKAEAPAELSAALSADAAQSTVAAKDDASSFAAVQALQTQLQAEQATAAGMDAFEHSQALAERRASGSQAGPSSPSAPTPGVEAGQSPPKAQIAVEVAEAAPLAALLPSSNGTTSALPAASQLPSASQAEGGSPSPSLLGTSGKVQLVDRLTGNIEGAVMPPAPVSKGSKRQKDAIERAAEGKAHLEGVAKLANELQPTGSTLSTMQVHTKVPFLLKHGLREYQHIGLDWLMTIYTRRLNGILADEMGLGKTIMTIALLAHLACEKGDWGPHLIVVPTSVMLNWEMEFKKWRKKWKYLILDEAHMIKNWKSQRWQTLLNFNSKRRLLITVNIWLGSGTPLQNDLMELWSLMHFLMPQIFASHAQFKDWFNNPLVGMVEGQQEVNKGIVERLHSVLRPFLLRRLKCDVEKQLPQKKEHVIRCRLSKRQRTLYEDYMASSDTSATLASSNFLGIINVLMQLRKVCNHPDLFEGRPIVSSFDVWGLPFHMPSLALHALSPSQWGHLNMSSINADVAAQEADFVWAAQRRQSLMAPSELIEGQLEDPTKNVPEHDETLLDSLGFPPSRQAVAVVQGFVQAQAARQQQWALSRLRHAAVLTARRCAAAPLYAIKTAAQRAESLEDTMKQFLVVIPQARSPPPTAWCSHPNQSVVLEAARQAQHAQHEWFRSSASLRTAIVRRQLFFPDRRLLQFDCGKLQELAQLLYQLKTGGHKALIFTQMTKMLDVLEAFLNLHGYTYLRLDGTTKPEQRQNLFVTTDKLSAVLQILMQRFNSNPKIFVFILSTRSGGVGMNLTGADTVIFYDSDWNPAMDAQVGLSSYLSHLLVSSCHRRLKLYHAQDRCHRIGQTREVHIYRLVSEKTIEENILTKSDQKRQLDHLAIQSGGFNTEFLQKFNPKELLGVQPGGAPNTAAATGTAATSGGGLSAEEMQAAMRSVEDETDAAAAAALEQENAAELAEFTMEPAARAAGEVASAEAGDDAEEEDMEADDIKEPSDSRPREQSMPISTSTAADPERPGPTSEPGPSTAIMPLAGADEDEMMEDVAQMAGGGQVSGQDALTNLESTLRPVEKYAVRFLEELQRQTAAESAAAEAEQLEMQEQEWNMAELERIQEQQACLNLSRVGVIKLYSNHNIIGFGNALAQQRAVEEEQRLLLEQLEEQAAAAAAARAEEEERLAARPQRKAAPRPVRSRAATPSSDSEELDSPVARYRGSRWAGKRELDEDRPLGRDMRFKQEPAHIQDSSFASGSDPLSPVASKRRRTQFTSSGPSRFARTGRASDLRQPPSDEAVQEGGNARTAARPARRLPRHIFSHGPAALTARGAPVQIWQPWEGVGAGSGSNNAPRAAGQQTGSVSSLTALIGQPLPPASQPPAHSTFRVASSPATAAAVPVSAQSTSAPAVTTASTTAVATMAASGNGTGEAATGNVFTAAVATIAASGSGTGQAATGNMSIGTSRPVPAVPQASMPQMPPGALAVATTGPQLTSPAATAARQSATASGIPTMSAAALSQPPASTAGVQVPSAAAPQLSSTSAGLGGQPPQPGFAPPLATASAALPGITAASRPMPSSSNVLLAPTVLPAQTPAAASNTPASVRQQQQVSGTAAAPQATKAFAPAARAGSASVGPGQGAAGSRTATVGEDVWQLASDVMAAGGTATTAAAVTTAAQQV
ncbi:MAG: helicase SWR1 [Trebouxia sp. A1-2]|nr:MAG: helicase SWR1 [Trebouxia sp. A1-2]